MRRGLGFFVLLSGVLFAASAAAEAIHRATFDLRDLPAATRVSGLEATFVSSGPRTDIRPQVTIAINGLIVARGWIGGGGRLTLAPAIEDRVQSLSNGVEVAVTTPGCRGRACAHAIEAVSLHGSVTLRLSPARAMTTDFHQLAPHLRSGVVYDLRTPADRVWAERLRQHLAPSAPVVDGADPRIVVGDRPPSLSAPLRLDLSPVALERRDGVVAVPAAMMDDLTVVQILRGGADAVIWIRPGRVMPTSLDVDNGDVALFQGDDRILAYSTARDDRTFRPAYAPGVDPLNEARGWAVWRGALVVAWVLATIGLLRVLRRRSPRPAVAA